MKYDSIIFKNGSNSISLNVMQCYGPMGEYMGVVSESVVPILLYISEACEECLWSTSAHLCLSCSLFC